MPIRMPVYNRQVQDAAAPAVRESGPASLDLSPLAQGVERAGSGAAHVVQRVQDEQDKAQIDGAIADLLREKQSVLDDPDNGFTTRKGELALAEHDVYQQRFDKFAEDVTNKLSPRIREKLAPHLNEIRLGVTDSLDRHTSGEAEALKVQKRQALLDAAASDAAAAAARGPGGIGDAQVAIHRGIGSIEESARLEGWGKEATQNAIRKWATQSHVAVMEQMLDSGRSADAKEYLTTVRSMGEVDPAGLGRIEKLIAGATLKNQAQATADEVWAKSGGDVSKAEGLVRGMKLDTDMLDETLQRVAQRGSAEADSPWLGKIEVELLRPGGGRLDPEMYERLSDEGKATAMRMWRAEQRARKAIGSHERGELNRSMREAIADFRNLAANDPEAASELDITSEYPDAGKEGRDRIGELQGKLREGRDKARGVLKADLTVLLRGAAEKHKLSGVSGGKVAKGSRAEGFITDMTGWYVDYFQEHGSKAPKPSEVQKAIDDWFVAGEEADGGLWNSDMYAGEARRKDIAFKPFDEQPAKTPPAPGGKVRVRRADGQTGTVPAKKLDAFLANNPGSEVIQ